MTHTVVQSSGCSSCPEQQTHKIIIIHIVIKKHIDICFFCKMFFIFVSNTRQKKKNGTDGFACPRSESLLRRVAQRHGEWILEQVV
jgi:hypothetical protein